MTISIIVYGLACMFVGALAGLLAAALCMTAKGG